MTDTKDDGTMRSFDTGATRDTGEDKLDFEGFLSPAVLRQYARFMSMNRLQSDGKLRNSDNWQKGIPMDVYMKSGFRHFFEWWEDHRRGDLHDGISRMAAMCGLLFNVMGYMHEYLQENDEVLFDEDEPTAEMAERRAKVRLTKEWHDQADRICDEQEADMDRSVDCTTQPCATGEHTVLLTWLEFPDCNEDPGDYDSKQENDGFPTCVGCLSQEKISSEYPCSECMYDFWNNRSGVHGGDGRHHR